MAENCLSFKPKGAFRAMGGCYYTEPRPATAPELRQIKNLKWKSYLATDAPKDTPVRVLLDDGTILETFTRSEPWYLGNGQWVVLLFGRAGGFALERVTPLG